MSSLKNEFATDRVTLLFAPGYHAVCYPLHHRDQFNIRAVCQGEGRPRLLRSPATRAQPAWAMLRSRHFDAIMKAAEGAWGFWPMSTVETATLHAGGIGLVGDAAHAMLPFQAQGAAMAIEDAAILAPLLITETTAETAFARYQAIRQARIEHVRKLSASNAFAFHMEWPFTMARDTVIRAQGANGHFRRLGWLYDYDAAPDPDIPPAPQVDRHPQSH